MTRSELLEKAINDITFDIELLCYNDYEEHKDSHELCLSLLLAEQKRSEGGCGICGGLEKLAEGEKTDPIPLYSNGKIYAKVCFVREEGVIWNRVIIGVNSYRVKMHWCSNCGRSLTEGESV